jgi:hypothetical protein
MVQFLTIIFFMLRSVSNKIAPPAFLNYLFFDREMNYKYGGFVQMSQAAREDGTNVPHEKLSQEVVADEAGYFYIYPPRLCAVA